MRAQADLIRANAQADRVKLEAEKVSISRADVVAKVRKAQEEIARSRMDRMAVAAPVPAMATQEPQIEPQPAMGATA
jgi:F0F1-type ATP synthase membrane subunit b/b'